MFRIGSITKVFTAIAVMQLCEEGLVDLDAPASNYLRSYELVCAGAAGFRPPTLRHLLTHTSGIPDVRHIFDLFHPDLSVKFGEPLPSLAEYYRGGLRVVASPAPCSPTPTMGSPRWVRSSRTSAGRRSSATSKSGSFSRSG